MRIPLLAAALVLIAASATADPLTCNLGAYKAVPGLTAAVANDALTVGWEGEGGAQLRKKWVRFAAWDVATNGAFVQPIRLAPGGPATTGR